MERPEPLQGGILADDMGLGNFALSVAANTPGSSVLVPPFSNDYVVELEDDRLEILLNHEEKQATDPGRSSSQSEKSGAMDGVGELQTFDIVLTTYNILSAERRLQESPINKIQGWRIILDEAHVIKNVNAQHSKAVMGLKMQCPITEGKASVLSLLQALMRKITVRRTKYLQIGSKSLVELPPKTVETCFVYLSPEEREQYDLMESNARMLLKGFIRNNSAMRNYSTIFCIILRLFQICNCVELCPSDMRPPCPSSSLGDISKNPKLQAKMTSILRGGDDVKCAVCFSAPTEAIITSCAHIFIVDIVF
ncbi:hypothetical protein MRB53_009704 [Persea americana]|uniref:Uncharacterized protein n=1 Tax=Persea americana TaxID=3435 RepID=A0ACC2LPX1_PERAE|nr:hypothetical protein MRB53_009704 [Persea americana]